MIRKPLIAVVVALAVLTLTGCEDDTDYECEYVTMTRPVFIGKQIYVMPYQECIPVQKEK